MKYCFLFIIIFLMGCEKKQRIKTEREYSIGYAVKAFSNVNKENDSIINAFQQCISTGKLRDYQNYWKKSDTLIFRYPYDDLWFSIEDHYPAYTPTLIAIQKKEANKYLVKMAVMGAPEGFNSLKIIYNFYAFREDNGTFKFGNVISDNLKSWKRERIQNITYVYRNDSVLSEEEVKRQIEFEDKLTSRFDFEKIEYKYIKCSTVHEFMKLRGYEYEDSMFLNNQTGGETFPEHRLIFSGNDSEYYPHELVHLYTHKYFKKINSIIDEGVATYLGGSKKMGYKNHIRILKKYVKDNNIDLYQYLFDTQKRFTIIGDGSSIKYSAGALLCHLADKQNVLKELLNSGESDEELIKKVEEIFKIDRKDIDAFFKQELEHF